MPFMPGSMVKCRSTPWTQTSRLSTRLQMSSSVLPCQLSSLSTSHIPASKKPFTETLSSQSALRKGVLAASVSINSSSTERSTISASLSNPTNVQCVVTAIWRRRTRHVRHGPTFRSPYKLPRWQTTRQLRQVTWEVLTICSEYPKLVNLSLVSNRCGTRRSW